MLLVDSGDLHDGQQRILTPSGSCKLMLFYLGTGLVDGYPPGGIDGHDVQTSSSNIVSSVPEPTNHLGSRIRKNVTIRCNGYRKVSFFFGFY